MTLFPSGTTRSLRFCCTQPTYLSTPTCTSGPPRDGPRAPASPGRHCGPSPQRFPWREREDLHWAWWPSSVPKAGGTAAFTVRNSRAQQRAKTQWYCFVFWLREKGGDGARNYLRLGGRMSKDAGRLGHISNSKALFHSPLCEKLIPQHCQNFRSGCLHKIPTPLG